MTQPQWLIVGYLALGCLAMWKLWAPITAEIPGHLQDYYQGLCKRHRRQQEILLWIQTGVLFVVFVVFWVPLFLAVLLYVIAQLRRR